MDDHGSAFGLSQPYCIHWLDRLALLRRMAHLARLVALGLRVLQGHRNLALHQIPATFEVVLLARLRDVDGLFFGLGLLRRRWLLSQGDCRKADHHEHSEYEREESAHVSSCGRMVPRGAGPVKLRRGSCSAVEVPGDDRIQRLAQPARRTPGRQQVFFNSYRLSPGAVRLEQGAQRADGGPTRHQAFGLDRL